MVMWTTTHCFDLFACNQNVLSQYVQHYRPTREETNIILDQLQEHMF